MKYNCVFNFFKDLPNEDPRITRKLVSNGYKQKAKGYIELAKDLGINNPTQWWHIMNYVSAKIKAGIGEKSYRYTPCGELLIYMAEVSNAVSKDLLEELVDDIISSDNLDDRKFWNNRIKDVCWDAIKDTIG